MLSSKVPEIPPKLVPGRDALYWYGMMLRGCIGAVVGIILFYLPVYLLPVHNSARWPLMLFFGGLTIAYTTYYLGISAVGVWKADKRENKAGYTTTYNYRKRALWQLDPKTGEVIRRPGDPITRRKR